MVDLKLAEKNMGLNLKSLFVEKILLVQNEV